MKIADIIAALQARVVMHKDSDVIQITTELRDAIIEKLKPVDCQALAIDIARDLFDRPQQRHEDIIEKHLRSVV